MIKPEYCVIINGEVYLAELGSDKPLYDLPGCVTVNLLNTSSNVIDENQIISKLDLLSLDEFGTLARILYL